MSWLIFYLYSLLQTVAVVCWHALSPQRAIESRNNYKYLEHTCIYSYLLTGSQSNVSIDSLQNFSFTPVCYPQITMWGVMSKCVGKCRSTSINTTAVSPAHKTGIHIVLIIYCSHVTRLRSATFISAESPIDVSWYLGFRCLYVTYELTPWLMEPAGSMPHSQRLSNYLYPEPNQFLVLTPISLGWNIILATHICIGLPRYLFPVGLPVKILKASLLSFFMALCTAHLDLIILTTLDELFHIFNSK